MSGAEVIDPISRVSAKMRVLGAVSFAHLINDLLQSLLPAIYPVLAAGFGLSFSQIGMIGLVYQLTASILQPLIGTYTDKRPVAFALPIGMAFTLSGLVVLSLAPSYAVVLGSVALIGIGSSIFHPESSRVARAASGGQHGFAQSIFQVGGNAGAALGPLLAAFVIAPRGQSGLLYCTPIALGGIALLAWVSVWAKNHFARKALQGKIEPRPVEAHMAMVMGVLIALLFSKYFYLASFTNYYTFYLIHHFGLSIPDAQKCLFVFLGAVAVGTVVGGPIGDRFGRKRVIWGSILGVLPFSLILPHLGLAGTVALTVPIGFMIASAFPAIVVYAQETMPGRTGMVSGLMFGVAFGFGGLGAALLGRLADAQGIDFVYQLCALLPAIGLLAVFLPEHGPVRAR